jgi:hypothetical protein
MRVPVQAPALVRNQRSRFVRRFDCGRVVAYGMRPSQYNGGEEGETGEEEEEGEAGGQGGDEGGSVESD